MAAEAVRFGTVEARLTAVVAQTTTWEEFPKLWGSLLDQVYECVRRHRISLLAMLRSGGRT